MENSQYLDELAKEAVAGNLLRSSIQKLKDDSLNRLSLLQNAKTSTLARLNVKSFEELRITSPNNPELPGNLLAEEAPPCLVNDQVDSQALKDKLSIDDSYSDVVGKTIEFEEEVTDDTSSTCSRFPLQPTSCSSSSLNISSSISTSITVAHKESRTDEECWNIHENTKSSNLYPGQSLIKLTENELKTTKLREAFHAVSKHDQSNRLTMIKNHPSITWNVVKSDGVGSINNRISDGKDFEESRLELKSIQDSDRADSLVYINRGESMLFDDDLDHNNGHGDWQAHQNSWDKPNDVNTPQLDDLRKNVYRRYEDVQQQQQLEFNAPSNQTQDIRENNENEEDDYEEYDEYVFDVSMSMLNKTCVPSPAPSEEVSSNVTSPSDGERTHGKESNTTKQESFDLSSNPCGSLGHSNGGFHPSANGQTSAQSLEDLFALIEKQHQLLVRMGLAT